MCEGDECIGVFWMTMCLIIIVNIFSPLTSVQDDYWSCSIQDGDIKIATIIDDRISSCHLRNNTHHVSKTSHGTCRVVTRLTNCSWYKDVEHFQRVSPHIKKEAFPDEHLANRYLTYMEERESKYWPHHGICVCGLHV